MKTDHSHNDTMQKSNHFHVTGESWGYQNATGDYIPGLLSVIVPCFNEEGNIRIFLNELSKVDVTPYKKEIIIINDGSEDGSATILTQLKNKNRDFTLIHFPRNFGQQQALMAGIRVARGEVLVTIDMDLQQPPTLIPAMIGKYEEGYQVVHAIPEYHRSVSLFKKITSKLYYKAIQQLGSETVVYKSNEFRLFSHRIARIVRIMPESNLYLRGIIMWLCPLVKDQNRNKVNSSERWLATSVKYRHRARRNGRTKYSPWQLLSLAFDGMTAISIQPLRFGLFLGMLSICLAMLLGSWALYMRLFTEQTVSGWTSLMVVVLFFCSIQFLLLGLIGEYIGKIFLLVKGRPGHIVPEQLSSRYPSQINRTRIPIPQLKHKLKQ